MTEYRRPLDEEDRLDIDEMLAGKSLPFGMSIEARRQVALEIDTRSERESGVTILAEALATRLEVSVEQVRQWREEFAAAPSEDQYVSRGMSWIEEGSLHWDVGDITIEWSTQPRREDGTIQARPLLDEIHRAMEAASRSFNNHAAATRPWPYGRVHWRAPVDDDPFF